MLAQYDASADWHNDATRYAGLSPEEQTALQAWIKLAIRPVHYVGKYSYSSYALKHCFEAVGFYVTNGEFKGAMQAAGYEPLDAAALNWQWRIAPTWPRKFYYAVYMQKVSYPRGWHYTIDHLPAPDLAAFQQVIAAGHAGQDARYERSRAAVPHYPVSLEVPS